MNIPNEAVEAAWDYFWHFCPDRPASMDEMRYALEAAAPHLMAAAWDECAKSQSRPDLSANPYRANE